MTQTIPNTLQPSWEDIAKGAAAGLVAGLVASLVMNQFQALVAKATDDEQEEGSSTTAKAADGIAKFATGKAIADDHARESAGNALHYALGGALGLAYGIAAEFRPAVTTGMGTGFGLSTLAVLDEAAVPAVGLAPPPTETDLSTHLYSAASHLVFGGMTEGVRRLARSAMD